MFDKFGKLDYEELNRCAAAQLKEGDEDAILSLAKENGIEEDDALDYIDGVADEFVTPLMAAVGRLKIEKEALELKEVLGDWADMISSMAADNKELAIGICKKDKSLAQCLGQIMKSAYENKGKIHDDIVKAAGLKPPMYIGIPSNAAVKKNIESYYGGGK